MQTAETYNDQFVRLFIFALAGWVPATTVPMRGKRAESRGNSVERVVMTSRVKAWPCPRSTVVKFMRENFNSDVQSERTVTTASKGISLTSTWGAYALLTN